ncbi:lipopolysaccharide biosynthesis protein [Streptococcus entericus]|uniref:lipopolysaccharide biosynthesis protein n=1 Tax=Streptococcus entericus TaxID=155680 RepID=UPI00036AE327|nr:hypothetical protein [Streptococcus entericus]
MSQQRSARAVFLWNLAGSLSTGLVAFLLFLGVSRTMPAVVSDRYSFIYAIGNLLSMLALFQVRNYQATDIHQRFSFSIYLAARLWTCLLTVLVAAIYGLWGGFSVLELVMLLLMTAYRITDALSDVFQGLFQQQERMDLAGKSLFFRNSLMLLVFNMSLFLTKNLILAMWLLLLVSCLAIIWWDLRPARDMVTWDWQAICDRQVLSLLKHCVPLFIIGFLLVYIYNQPKYALNSLFEEGYIVAGAQRDFNILFMPIFVMNLLTMLLRPMITQLAVYFTRSNWSDFRQLIRRIFLYLSLLSATVLLGGHLLAIPVLSTVYSTDLSAYKTTFMILLVGGVLSSFATILDNLVTVFRYQKFLVLSFGLAWLVSLLIAGPLVRWSGIFGAAVSYLLTMVVWLVGLSVTYAIIFKKVRSTS